MNRVVITGLGIVSSIGNCVDDVLHSLCESRCGMVYMPEMKELGYGCCVYAPVPDLDVDEIPQPLRPLLSIPAAYAFLAAEQAINDARLSLESLSSETTGLIVGTGAGGSAYVPGVEEPVRRDLQSIDRWEVLKVMNSTAAAILSTHWGIQGRCCSLSATCDTGLYNIGHAYELLKFGTGGLSVCICGSAEEDMWKRVGISADNSDGMPRDFNDRPVEACRPFDRDRQGFVMSAGSGMVVLETLEHAEHRGAPIYAEVVGYGAANDGADMFTATGVGMRNALRQAMQSAHHSGVRDIDYIHAHATGTVGGDRVEAGVIREIFEHRTMVSSTKGATGHAMSATAAQELVFTLIMLHHGFVAPTRNLENIDPDCSGIDHVRSLRDVSLRTTLNMNNGLGGSNACMVLKKL